MVEAQISIHLNKETSASTPPNRAGVWDRVKLVERAAGLAVSSGLIQVSVRAMRLRPEW